MGKDDILKTKSSHLSTPSGSDSDVGRRVFDVAGPLFRLLEVPIVFREFSCAQKSPLHALLVPAASCRRPKLAPDRLEAPRAAMDAVRVEAGPHLQVVFGTETVSRVFQESVEPRNLGLLAGVRPITPNVPR
jgi:hypothetical protein